MRIRGFKKLLSPTEWAGHDESGVDLAVRGRFTRLQISHECDVQLVKQIVFARAFAVHEASFPGVMPFEMKWDFKSDDVPFWESH